MRLSIRATADYDLENDTFLLLRIEPALQGQWHRVTSESLCTTPTPFSELWTDGFNNPQRRLGAPAGFFTFDFQATVECEPNGPVPPSAVECAPRELPAAHLVYTLPSRYCQRDLLGRMARDEFGDVAPGGARVSAISAWLRRHVEYRYGATDSMASAYDTATQRVGVGGDFAHLFIAFCRALQMPARYVSGYCLGLDPPGFHGYAQVWLGDAWHNVDATFAGVRRALVPIAVGRDAADVALLTLWGRGVVREQSVDVEEITD